MSRCRKSNWAQENSSWLVLAVIFCFLGPCIAVQCYTGSGVMGFGFGIPVNCMNDTSCFKLVVGPAYMKGCGTCTSVANYTGTCFLCSTDQCNSAINTVGSCISLTAAAGSVLVMKRIFGIA